MSEIVSFSGPVSCRRSSGPLGLTLSGATGEHPGDLTTCAFAAPAPAQFPAALEGAQVQDQGGGQYRITSSAGAWLVSARSVHVHRAAGAEFYRALAPRRVPSKKRLFWRLVLALAASRAGLSVLRALRR